MHVVPVASATPDGRVRINRFFTNLELENAQVSEIVHFMELVEAVSENGFYRRAIGGQMSGSFIGSRRAVIAEFGELPRIMSRGDGSKTRSHSRSKARLRDRRTIRQLSLAA